jgi:CHASE3 domain sensor protein
MKRIAIIFSIISVILLVYGLIDYLTNYNWAQGDQDPLFGNQNVLLNDGATVLIAGGLLTVGSVLMWVLALRKGDGNHQP